jgi:hypothetical protein
MISKTILDSNLLTSNSNNDLRKQQRMTSNAPALLDYNSPRIV